VIKRFVKGVLGKLGYELRKTQAIGLNPSYLSQICQPRTVIDVGVGRGTFPLYEAFPKAHFILIEPLKEYGDSIEKIAKKYDCDIHFKAVGNRECRLEINIDRGDLQDSSFMDRTSLTRSGNPLEKRTVEVTTLDTIYNQSSTIEGPILLKIDTEGHELSVLKGARSLLQVVDVVIVKVTIAKRFENSYEFEDIVFFMNENGFYVFSFLTMARPKGEVRQRFADVVFKRRGKNT
jgi:FkbM family methyltransferase